MKSQQSTLGGDEIDNRTRMKQLVKNPLFIIGVIGTIVFIFQAGQMGPMNTDKSYVYYIFFILILVIIQFSWTAMRHKTAKIISNPYFSTTRGKFRSAGNFLVFSMGDIDAAGISVRGSKGTIIGPKDAVQKMGDNIALNVKTEQKPFDQLPAEVRATILEHDYEPPYHIGYANEEQLDKELDDKEQVSGMKQPDVSRVIRQLEETNEMNQFLMDVIDDKYDQVEDVMEAMDRIGVHKEGSLGKKIKGSILDQE